MRPIRLQGRTLAATDLSALRQWLARHPQAPRTALARHLCERWDWRTDAGRLKDMAARTLLLKLERRGLLTLPPRRRFNPPGAIGPPTPAERFVPIPVGGPLAALRPLQLTPAHTPAQRRQFTQLVRQFHYLGLGRPVGENLGYLVASAQGQPLAVTWFGAPAWQLAARDHAVGWSATQRARALSLLANQSRFVLLPGVQVPHLASHVLTRLSRRVAADWQAKYGHRLVLLETFVEVGRFAGAAYRAAGWQCVGLTTGRSRQDRWQTLRVPVKAIWLYPLQPQWRARLHGAPELSA